MTSNIHPVVELLAARMESHPEEFEPNGGGRWAEWLDRLIPFVTEEERVMLRRHMMQDIHEEVLDELLNGEERRAREKHERDLEMQQMMAQRQQSMLAAQQAQKTLHGVNPTHVWMDDYPNMGIGTRSPSQPLVIGTGKEAMRIQANGEIKIGDETLSEGLLKQIKKALGL